MTAAKWNFSIALVDNTEIDLFFGQGARRKIRSFADAGSGSVTVTTEEAHGLSNGNKIIIRSKYYVGVYTVANATSTTFTIVATWEESHKGGTWQDVRDLTGKTITAEIFKKLNSDAAALCSWTISYPAATFGHARATLLLATKTANLSEGAVYCDFILTTTATSWPEHVIRSKIIVE